MPEDPLRLFRLLFRLLYPLSFLLFFVYKRDGYLNALFISITFFWLFLLILIRGEGKRRFFSRRNPIILLLSRNRNNLQIRRIPFFFRFLRTATRQRLFINWLLHMLYFWNRRLFVSWNYYFVFFWLFFVHSLLLFWICCQGNFEICGGFLEIERNGWWDYLISDFGIMFVLSATVADWCALLFFWGKLFVFFFDVFCLFFFHSLNKLLFDYFEIEVCLLIDLRILIARFWIFDVVPICFLILDKISHNR